MIARAMARLLVLVIAAGGVDHLPWLPRHWWAEIPALALVYVVALYGFGGRAPEIAP